MCCASTRSVTYLLYVSDTQSTLSVTEVAVQPYERGPMNPPAPRALALRTTGITYPGTPEHISAVRTDLRPILRGCPMADDVILCASELAANAAIHSRSRLPGGTFTVRAKLSPGDYAWLEVEDNGGPWTPAVRDPSQHHGLDIVRALASEYGVDGDRPHHLGPLRLDRVMAPRPTGHPDRWTAVIDGQRLRELRRQQALSQAELAKLAGVSAHTVSKLERQPASCCRSRTLARLAAALGESPAAITASMGQRSD
jgi:serine/threonine-protein kinase RsbW